MAELTSSPTELRFDGQVAIITGAGGNPGLGRSYALLIASRGGKVVVNDLGVGPDGRGAIGTGVEEVVREIRDAGGEAVGNANSVADRDSAREIVQVALDTWGRVDVVINNAGIAPFASFSEISDRDIERVVGVHLMGHIWMCRAAWPHFAAQRYGRLVNVSSAAALIGLPMQSIYAACKLGVVGLTRVLAAEGEALGIKANAIMPAATTLAWQTMAPEFGRQQQAAGVVPEVVAPVAAWLAHDRCSFSGKVIDASTGAFREVFFSRTAGTDETHELSLEDVDARIDIALDRSAATPVPDPGGASDLPNHKVEPYSTEPRV